MSDPRNDPSTPDFDPFAGGALLAAVPSTEPQREIWTAAQIGEDANLAYNESVSVLLEGALNTGALEAALADLVQRHEALRATFSADGTQMLVNASADVALARVDLSGLAPDAQRAEIEALRVRAVTEPFRLATGPLARASLVKLRPDLHQLVFTAHHIVCDGWSTAVLMRDWAHLYTARVTGQPAALAPAEAFSAYARSLADAEHSPRHAADEAYWVNRFSGDIPVLELPTDRPRPPLKTYASRREDLVLEAPLVRDLKRSGGRERASLFAVLLAGFKALLGRLSGQEDLVVGIPAAGQSVGGHQDLVGHCVSMLPLRARLDAGKPFQALLADVRATLLDGYEHQEYTVGSLLKKLPIARDPSRLPLVSVIFNVDRGMGPDALPFAGLKAQLESNARRFETYDLFLNAVELDGRVTLECQYNADLFDGGTVRRWLKAYERLLTGAVAALEKGAQGGPLGELPILSEEEKARLDAWNAQSALDVDARLRVHDLIAAQAARTPDAVAVRFEGKALTYRALEARANAVAAKLRELGVGRGELVGLCVERSADLVAGLLGVLKAGAGYVPLDPGYPRERLAFMVQDASIRVLLTQEAVRRELALEAAHVVTMESLPAEAPVPEHDPMREPGPEDVCYVIFTSGSTGKPKGVLVPHRAVVNLLASVQRTPGLTAQDVVLAVTTLSFDIAVSEVILPLTVGATIELASREVASDGGRLLALLRESKATFLDATPATYRLLIGAGWEGGDLKKCICTGEAMPKDLAQELVRRVPSVWNGYGPTETTVWSTFYEVKPPIGRILIGKPVANTQVYVLDARRQPVPLGVVGELYIGGRGVTLGYLNRPELTRDRFVPNPFGEGLLYRTGDLVRFLLDGDLECLGRNDNQVKVRGFRIELGEIEDALGQQPAVKQAAVVVRELKAGDIRLVGYVVLHPGQTASDNDLRAHLKKTLPDYMVPQNLVRLDKMPLTPSGKIDRKALPTPQASQMASADFVAPRTETEKLIATLFQEALSVGRVGATDDFFALGGHSLLASQLLARLKRDQGVVLSFRKIFEAPTVEKLAVLVEQARQAGAPAPQGGIPRRAETGPAPLSVQQQRLWLLEEMDPAQRNVHSLPAAWKLTGKLDPDLLQRAVDEVVRRHATLRTNIRVENGQPVQVITADRRILTERTDLSQRPADERQRGLDAAVDRLVLEEFDLASDALLRLHLVKLTEEEHALLLAVHNIIWDGWSFDLFLKQLSDLYSAFVAGKPSPLPELPISYADFATWQRGFLESADMARQVAYWRERLGGDLAPVDLPTDRPRGGTRSHAGANDGINIPREVADALTALGQREGATLFTVLFTAFNVLLHRYTGQRDVLVGSPVRARTQVETEELIGPFTNNVILRTTVSPGQSFLELLRHVRDITLDAFSNQDMPLEKLGERPPIVRAFFSLQDARTRPPRFGDVAVSQFHAKPPSAANELMLWTMETRTHLLAMLNFSTDLFDAPTMQRFLEQLRTLLSEVLKDPSRPVGHIPVLTEDERRTLATWLDTAAEAPASVAALVAERAARAPDAVAAGKLTWAALEARSNRMARWLQAQGIQGKPISVKLAPGEERAVALLALWKAGAHLALDGDAARTVEQLDEAQWPADASALPAPAATAPAYRARGATLHHGALAGALASLRDRCGLGAEDVTLDALPLDGPEALIAAILPWAAGARAHPTPGVTTDPLRLARALEEAGATFLAAPSALWEDVLDSGWQSKSGFKALCLGIPSRKLEADLSQRAPNGFSTFLPWNVPVPVALHRLGSQPAHRRMLGKALANVQLRVLDAQKEPVPMGAHGVLHVAFAGGQESATGDRVRYLVDGSLERVGRADGRVEVRGALADLNELARTLATHEGVERAAVRLVEDTTGKPTLVAYVVPKAGEAYTDTELRRLVRNGPGEAFVPRYFVELESLPTTAAGAVDDDRLPLPWTGQEGEDFVPPRDEAEKLLASVWQDALRVPRVGIYDNFFNLGGHSLLCFQVIGALERQTGIRLNPRTFLLGTLEQAAAQLSAAARTAGPVSAAPSASAPTAPAAPAAPAPAAAPQSKGLLGRFKDLLKR